MKTYGDILEILESNGDLYIPTFYHTGRYEWFKVDKEHYMRDIRGSDLDFPYPCYVEVENDGEIFLHPKIENK
jgi:hypothetical protein